MITNLFLQVSGSKIWQMERSCMCCQESGEREASVSLFCPKAKPGERKFRKVDKIQTRLLFSFKNVGNVKKKNRNSPWNVAFSFEKRWFSARIFHAAILLSLFDFSPIGTREPNRAGKFNYLKTDIFQWRNCNRVAKKKNFQQKV